MRPARLYHGCGLGDDSPIAIYKPRDDVMANWILEENSAFIIEPLIRKANSAKRFSLGDTVVCTERGVRRLGERPPSILEIG